MLKAFWGHIWPRRGRLSRERWEAAAGHARQVCHPERHVSGAPSVHSPCPALSPRAPTHGRLSWLQVFSYIATLLYVIHAIYSLIRWKSS